MRSEIISLFLNNEHATTKLSKDGSFFVFLKPYLKYQNLWVRRLNSHTEINLTSQQINNIETFAIKNDKYIFYTVKNKLNETFSLFMYNLLENINVEISNNFQSGVIAFDILEDTSDEHIAYYEESIISKDIKQYIFNINSMISTENFKFKKDEFLRINSNEQLIKWVYNENLHPLYTYKINFKNYNINKISINKHRKELATFSSFVQFKILGKLDKFLLVKTFASGKFIFGKYDQNLKLKATIFESTDNFAINKIYIKNNQVEKFDAYHPSKNLIKTHYYNKDLENLEHEIKTKLLSEFALESEPFISIDWSENKSTCLIATTSTTTKSETYLFDTLSYEFQKISKTDPLLFDRTLPLPEKILYANTNFIFYKSINKKQNKKKKILITFDQWPFLESTYVYDLKYQLLAARDYNVVRIFIDSNIEQLFDDSKHIDAKKFEYHIILLLKRVMSYLNQRFYKQEISYTFLLENLLGYVISTIIIKLNFKKNIIFDQALVGLKNYKNATISSWNFNISPSEIMYHTQEIAANQNNFVLSLSSYYNNSNDVNFYHIHENTVYTIRNHFKDFDAIVFDNIKNKTKYPSNTAEKIIRIINIKEKSNNVV
ncbi:Uncharacterised protein [Mycoplasmopsis californica]|uniref:Uncharacterized protein n=1 Tax=Mycoplasmopsis equigenitalium TaxID=114883 RepID=A0ABY5J1V9_9BACT|nr:hypothetical protein [Mycoplasmopsis equigenitalium]UUD36753.1 hypothetical protein NPA09_02525 [Mycoplasmopsis equigenitalium]VEU69952.1 Uncharacterised protein [Mycoplasmopsis californica]